MNNYLKLLKFIRPYLRRFLLAGVCMVFSALFDGVSLAMIVPLTDKVLSNKPIILPAKAPVFVVRIAERINATPALNALYYMAGGILILFLLKGVINFIQGYLMSDIGQRVVRDIKARLYARLQLLSLDFFTKKRGGELISRITNDVKLVENAVSYGSTDLIYETFQVLIFSFLVVAINPRLGLLALVVLPVFSFIIIKVGRALRKLSRRSQEKMADINSLLSETIFGTRIVKAFTAEEQEVRKFNAANQEYYKITMKSIKRTLLLGPLTEFLGCLVAVAVLVWGGKAVLAERMSFGVFALSLGALLSMIRPFKKLSQVHSLNQQALAASERIHEVLEAVPSVIERENARVMKGFSRNVVFEDVWFKYEDQDILKGVSLEVNRGEILAVVGPSGSGKTTLVDLVPRFYDPHRGRVLIDGEDIRAFTLRSLRQSIGIVTQETILFNDTIRANIAYGVPGSSQERIEEAARQANAHNFIVQLPQGYETMIGDRGTKLSGGERQRIAIARALLKDPPILILDEATSQLDLKSEKLVQDALDKLIVGRTVFLVAHRLSTVRYASCIIFVDEGRIVERGSHEELLRKDGLYRCLYQVQEARK